MSQTQHRSRQLAAMLARAAALHDEGRLQEAEQAVRQVLAQDTDNPDALNLFGSIAFRAGHPEAAAQVLTMAIQRAPRLAEARINLGHALKVLGRTEEALKSYQAAVALGPKNPAAHYALGGGLIALSNFAAAETALREATRLDPKFAGAFNNLGHVLRQLKRPKDAEAAFRRAIALNPANAEWHLNLALAIGEQHRIDDTIGALKDALRLAPDHFDALHAYGTLLVKARRFDDAVAPLRRLRERYPHVPDPFCGLAQALTGREAFDEALEIARDTAARFPNDVSARFNLAVALLTAGRLTEAEAAYEATLSLDPGNGMAHIGRSFARLLDGRLEEAWDDYEYRLEVADTSLGWGGSRMVDVKTLAGELWTGEPRRGRTLLVYQEQGQGDAIQMVRYAASLAKDSPVIWVVSKSLRRLFAGAAGVTSLLTDDDPIPPHDLHCSTMSLPRSHRTSLATIPGGASYLTVGPDEIASWRSRLPPGATRKIGLAWQGNPGYYFDRMRSLPAGQLAALDGVRDTVFVSLQLPKPAVPPPLPMIDLTDDLGDFRDTAALISALDLVICVDTSIAHLAGALGRPVWLLNRFASDWRWMLHGSDSPWYPSMRIFRQPAPRDWASVMAEVRAALDAGAP